MQADVLFDECLAIADGRDEYAGRMFAERRLQIDTRKWMAVKLPR